MKKNLFLLLLLSALCVLAYGCGNDEIETESSVPIVENVSDTTNTIEPTTSTTISGSENSKSTTSLTNSKTTNVTTITTVTTGVSDSSSITSVSATVTYKSPSGETEFKQITAQHVQYEARTPSVLKSHDPVIYTTAPATTDTNETETTVIGDSNDNDEFEEFDDNQAPELFSSDEMYYCGVKIGDDASDLLYYLGDYESMNYSPSNYYIDDIQGEDRHYYFDGLEVLTCYFDDFEILKEVIIKDDSYYTSRGISIGMTTDDMFSLYGAGEFVGNCYIYYSDANANEYIYFNVDDDIIESIGYCKLLR